LPINRSNMKAHITPILLACDPAQQQKRCPS
jgi:hypothetical protein